WGNDPREAWALPQVYGEVAYHNLSVIMGHFLSPLGYETVQAPGNFFYSHSFAFNHARPFTHTGAMATWDRDDLTLYGGWVAGNDTAFELVDGGSAFLGGFRYRVTENV